MTDDAYIKPSEREGLIECSDVDNYQINAILGEYITKYESRLHASHAVADSVAADLADAVDALIEAWPGVMDGQLFHKAMTASIRFDNLTKGTE